MRIHVRSRIGNAVLGVLGVVYVSAAIVLLGYHAVQTWDAAAPIDRGVQVVLLACVAVGILFVVTAVQNLGFHWTRREARPRQEDAAAAR